MSQISKEEIERFVLIYRILLNGKELFEEALILKEHGKLKRAGFLLISSIEEFLKYWSLTVHRKEYSELLTHESKFYLLREVFQKVGASISVDKIQTDLPEELKPHAARFVSGFRKQINHIFNFSRVREVLLYAHPSNVPAPSTGFYAMFLEGELKKGLTDLFDSQIKILDKKCIELNLDIKEELRKADAKKLDSFKGVPRVAEFFA